MDYKALMQQAISLAKEAATKSDVPVGALVVDDAGNVVGQGANLRVQDNDPTAHAEIVALRNAAKKTNNYRLDDLTMVVTLEPCGMCAGAIAQSRIKRLVFGAFDDEYKKEKPHDVSYFVGKKLYICGSHSKPHIKGVPLSAIIINNKNLFCFIFN